MDWNLIIGAIGLVLAYIGLNYARKTFRKDHVDKPNEEKLHLQAQFKATQTLAKQVYSDFYTYVESYNAFDQFMSPGITYGAYLSEMKNSQEDNLSDKRYELLKTEPLPSITIQAMCKSLETQFEALNLIHQEVKLKMRSDNE